jgi:lysophospholipase L1-like esterase
MKHIILAGDSVFDNRTYVEVGEPDVRDQLADLLDDGDKATLIAVDGDINNNVSKQLDNIPNDATHLFISIGGNDALMHIDAFTETVTTIGDALDSFNEMVQEFERNYIKMLTNVIKYGLKTTLCTIYNPCFDHDNIDRIKYMFPPNTNFKKLQRRSTTALPLFNNIIFQEAFNFGLPVMDLRLIFNDMADYSNPIEPSVVGGMKMARIIKEISYNHDFSMKNSVVFK